MSAEAHPQLHFRVKDITGQVFGRLTVVGFAGRRLQGARLGTFWSCRCSCGNVTVVRGDVLRSGGSTSCGCWKGAATHCPHGHELTPDNIYWDKHGSTRKCRICHNARIRARRLADPEGFKARRRAHYALNRESILAKQLVTRRRKGIKPLVTHGLSAAAEYDIWSQMKARCLDPAHHAYKHYGARGIAIHPPWLMVENFIADIRAQIGPRPSPKHSLDRIDVNGNYEPGNVRWATATEQARNTRSNRLLTFQGETLPLVAWSEKLGIGQTTLGERLKRGWTVDAALTIPVEPRTRRAAA